jgi:CMP-2-keto-3-deoxyoctulosonic acid synthetase
MTKVYLVGESGCEHDMLLGIYANRDKALVAFQEHRLQLLEDAKRGLEWGKEEAKKHLESGKWFDGRPLEPESIEYFKKRAEEGEDMYLEMIKKLSEEDPEKIDNFPHDTPYLREEVIIE